jgi:DNA (cytosine-5)-methyltransferase 1
VLDAQYFGVAQRRRRVFVVGYLGDWRRAAAVLFERHSLSGHPAPSREKGQGFTDRIAPSVVSNGDADSGFRDEHGIVVCPVQVAFGIEDGLAHCLRSGASKADKPDSTTYVAQPVAFQSSQSGVRVGDTHATLDANNGSRRHNGIATASAVRRLTPRECERLQGFPDDYTAIPWRKKGSEDCPDGPRYKALGNSMAVPVMHWIGERIAAVEKIIAVFPEAEVVK